MKAAPDAILSQLELLGVLFVLPARIKFPVEIDNNVNVIALVRMPHEMF